MCVCGFLETWRKWRFCNWWICTAVDVAPSTLPIQSCVTKIQLTLRYFCRDTTIPGVKWQMTNHQHTMLKKCNLKCLFSVITLWVVSEENEHITPMHFFSQRRVRLLFFMTQTHWFYLLKSRLSYFFVFVSDFTFESPITNKC